MRDKIKFVLPQTMHENLKLNGVPLSDEYDFLVQDELSGK